MSIFMLAIVLSYCWLVEGMVEGETLVPLVPLLPYYLTNVSRNGGSMPFSLVTVFPIHACGYCLS